MSSLTIALLVIAVVSVLAVIGLCIVLRDRKALLIRDCQEHRCNIQQDLDRLKKACEHLPATGNMWVSLQMAQRDLDNTEHYLKKRDVWSARLCLFSALSGYRYLLGRVDFVPVTDPSSQSTNA